MEANRSERIGILCWVNEAAALVHPALRRGDLARRAPSQGHSMVASLGPGWCRGFCEGEPFFQPPSSASSGIIIQWM